MNKKNGKRRSIKELNRLLDELAEQHSEACMSNHCEYIKTKATLDRLEESRQNEADDAIEVV